MNGNVKVNKEVSLYCGDAAGRTQPKKDFNDTDLKFALNVGLKFYTPEQLFLGEEAKAGSKKEESKASIWDPKTLPRSGQLFIETKDNAVATSAKQEMVLFCGSAGSGKSTFWKNYMKKYVRVNRDTLNTKEKCLQVAE